jgi:hypothetical protein
MAQPIIFEQPLKSQVETPLCKNSIISTISMGTIHLSVRIFGHLKPHFTVGLIYMEPYRVTQGFREFQTNLFLYQKVEKQTGIQKNTVHNISQKANGITESELCEQMLI